MGIALRMAGGLMAAHCITGDTLNAGERSQASEIAKIRKWLDAGGRIDQLEFDDPINIANDSTAGSTSGTAFQDAVADYIVRYKAAGGSPFAYNIQSWYDHPTTNLPETVNGTLARTILNAHGSF